jgi:hypothetical protein
LILVCAGTLLAARQHGYRVTKRIAFKKGQVATVVKGAIPNTLEGHEYVLRARQGQTLTIRLYSTKKDINFSIWAPSGEMVSEETSVRRWSGELAETGDYRIVINTESDGVARYSLEVQIASDI